jgi:hypothetical protein
VVVLDEGRCEDFGSLGVEARNGETATAGGGEGKEDAETLPLLTLEDGEVQGVCARMESRRLMT